MAQINTMFRNPFHAVFETLGETIMRGELDPPTYCVEEPTSQDIEFGITEDTTENSLLLSKRSRSLENIIK